MAICSYKAQEGSINLVPVYNWIKRCAAEDNRISIWDMSKCTAVRTSQILAPACTQDMTPVKIDSLQEGSLKQIIEAHGSAIYQLNSTTQRCTTWRRSPEEPRASRKVAKVDGVHTKHAIPPSNYHQSLTTLLDSKNFQRVPRQGFKNVLDFAKVRDKVVLRSLGEGPTHSGGAFQLKTIIVTERMESLWKEFSSGCKTRIRRVLAGPVGIGKSSLALYLAARAYTAGSLTLYVADYSRLLTNDPIESAIDILTTADLQRMVLAEPSEECVLDRAQ
ncbi:MAG: hypothetical protein J3Q66DRAFT_407263 [Benniella sp.]|nr:MAG: hypothetical protein J3Q66DRAFT_407263 [Benniella sp.]